ncbi:acylphosphatase [Roseibium sp. RKSG952]|uniref:acylphosphatase n=1 Tax=Roseibium sp. RKSG952 TaxID=2529384 RepID=UPI0034CD09E2
MTKSDKKAVHILIIGRVQGVGFRQWLDTRAKAEGLSGWVRNRKDGSVEAVLSGGADAVHSVMELARDGPSLASVREVKILAEVETLGGSFQILSTV